MKRVLAAIPVCTLWAIGSLALTHTWMTNPDLFPTLPMSFWNWLDRKYGTGNAEDVADLEFLVIFIMSALVLTACMTVFFLAWRNIGKRR